MAWGTLSTVEKVASVIVSVAAALGVLYAVYSHFQTDVEAKVAHDHLEEDMLTVQKAIAANQQLALKREAQSDIARHDREISRLERDLAGGKYSNPDEKEFILREIQRLENLKKALRDESGN